MAGTRAGGLKAAATLKAKDKKHFAKIGGKGGRNGTGTGFASNPDLAKVAGKQSAKARKELKKRDEQ